MPGLCGFGIVSLHPCAMFILCILLSDMPHFSDAAPSFEANLNDTRCMNGSGVCPTDPLLFTCRGTDLAVLRVIVPTDGTPVELALTSSGMIAADEPPGITIVSLNATQNSLSSYDYEMLFSIQNASLLYGMPILCDGGTPAGQVSAGCALVGEYCCNIA